MQKCALSAYQRGALGKRVVPSRRRSNSDRDTLGLAAWTRAIVARGSARVHVRRRAMTLASADL